VVNAVNTGLQAASQTLTPSNTVSPPLLK
jgi:hypothetical protein